MDKSCPIEKALQKIQEQCVHIPIILERTERMDTNLTKLNNRVGTLEDKHTDSRVESVEMKGKINGLEDGLKEHQAKVWKFVSPIISTVITASILGGVAYFVLQQ